MVTKSKGGIPEKYVNLRNDFMTGDIVLYRGTSTLAKSIQYFDKAYYNHIGIVWDIDDIDKVLTLDMWSKGLTCVPLSRRMDGYHDFCILRPKVRPEAIKHAISSVLNDWDGRNIKYDNMLLLRVAIVKKTGIDITGLGSTDKFICSEFVKYYTDLLGLDTYADRKLITPEDFRRYIDANFDVLYDDAPAPDTSYKDKWIQWSRYKI